MKDPAGWKAGINGDTITALGPKGLKFEFRNGHIISMTTPDNRKLEYVYPGPIATEIRENGKTLLKAEQNMGVGPVTALLFNDKREAITLDQKPRVQSAKGQNFIVTLDRSLKSLNPTEGTSKTFEVAVDDKIQPTLKISGTDGKENLFTWNPASQRIISEDDWNYKIEPGKEPTDTAAITRTNSNRQSEYWFYDTIRGQETTISDGITTVLQMFTSGYLANRSRSFHFYQRREDSPV